jgi:hypothetical protein
MFDSLVTTWESSYETVSGAVGLPDDSSDVKTTGSGAVDWLEASVDWTDIDDPAVEAVPAPLPTPVRVPATVKRMPEKHCCT